MKKRLNNEKDSFGFFVGFTETLGRRNVVSGAGSARVRSLETTGWETTAEIVEIGVNGVIGKRKTP